MINKIKCWLGWHDWATHKTVNIGYTFNETVLYSGWGSIRTCAHCKRDELFDREVGWHKVNLNEWN